MIEAQQDHGGQGLCLYSFDLIGFRKTSPMTAGRLTWMPSLATFRISSASLIGCSRNGIGCFLKYLGFGAGFWSPALKNYRLNDPHRIEIIRTVRVRCFICTLGFWHRFVLNHEPSPSIGHGISPYRKSLVASRVRRDRVGRTMIISFHL